MIEGEKGTAIFARVVAHQMDALVDGDEITCALIGSVLSDALRKDMTPRAVAEDVYRALPSDEEWHDGLRDRVQERVDAEIEGYGDYFEIGGEA